MKTTFRSNAKFFLVTVGLWLLLLITCPQSAIGQTNTFPASGNAGVGTTSPTEKLEVVGTVKSSGGITITGAPGEPAYLNALYLGMAGNTAIIDAVDQMVDFRDLVISAKTFRVGTWNGGGLVTGLFQNNNGNVGIGTTAPNASLHLFSTALNPMLVLEASSAVSSTLEFRDGAATQNRWRVGSGMLSQTDGRFGIFDARQSQYRIIIDTSGNVGLGTTSPGARLDVRTDAAAAGSLVGRFGNDNASGGGALRVYANTAASSTLYPAFELTDNSYWLASIAADRSRGLRFRTGSNVSGGESGLGDRMVITASGNVGIGTTNPQKPLDVVGDVNASGTITGGTIVAKYQDVAEWVPASHALPAGTVVTLDPSKSNHVEASSQAYDTRVAGVVSEQPGITLGESGENKVLVATTGRVRVTVDASHAPIHIGDLLVTSDIPGVAMKSEPITIGGRQIHSPGTLIGKALEPLEKGSGKILVLLSLQ
jgi:hypothetical protein